MTKKAISRHYERSEMVPLSKTRSKILLLLVLLMGCQYLYGVLGLIGFGISGGNTDIQNTVKTTGPETMDKKITTIIIGRGQWGRGGRWSRNQRSHRSGCMTGVNKGFVTYSTGSEGTGSKVGQLIT